MGREAHPSTGTPAGVPAALARRPTGFLLQLAHRLARAAANEALRPYGIDLRHVGVLALLAEVGPLTQRRLVDGLEMDKSSMVYVIDELERQELAERRRAPADRRAYEVHITDAGRDRLRAAAEAATGVMDEVLAPLDPAERAQLDALLSRIVEHARHRG